MRTAPIRWLTPGAEPARNGRPTAGAWSSLPPLRPAVARLQLTAPSARFVRRLATRRVPQITLAPLRHEVSLTAPRGLVSGIARVATVAVDGPPLEFVSRVAAPVEAAEGLLPELRPRALRATTASPRRAEAVAAPLTRVGDAPHIGRVESPEPAEGKEPETTPAPPSSASPTAAGAPPTGGRTITRRVGLGAPVAPGSAYERATGAPPAPPPRAAPVAPPGAPPRPRAFRVRRVSASEPAAPPATPPPAAPGDAEARRREAETDHAPRTEPPEGGGSRPAASVRASAPPAEDLRAPEPPSALPLAARTSVRGEEMAARSAPAPPRVGLGRPSETPPDERTPAAPLERDVVAATRAAARAVHRPVPEPRQTPTVAHVAAKSDGAPAVRPSVPDPLPRTAAPAEASQAEETRSLGAAAARSATRAQTAPLVGAASRPRPDVPGTVATRRVVDGIGAAGEASPSPPRPLLPPLLPRLAVTATPGRDRAQGADARGSDAQGTQAPHSATEAPSPESGEHLAGGADAETKAPEPPASPAMAAVPPSAVTPTETAPLAAGASPRPREVARTRARARGEREARAEPEVSPSPPPLARARATSPARGARGRAGLEQPASEMTARDIVAPVHDRGKTDVRPAADGDAAREHGRTATSRTQAPPHAPLVGARPVARSHRPSGQRSQSSVRDQTRPGPAEHSAAAPSPASVPLTGAPADVASPALRHAPAPPRPTIGHEEAVAQGAAATPAPAAPATPAPPAARDRANVLLAHRRVSVTDARASARTSGEDVPLPRPAGVPASLARAPILVPPAVHRPAGGDVLPRTAQVGPARARIDAPAQSTTRERGDPAVAHREALPRSTAVPRTVPGSGAERLPVAEHASASPTAPTARRPAGADSPLVAARSIARLGRAPHPRPRAAAAAPSPADGPPASQLALARAPGAREEERLSAPGRVTAPSPSPSYPGPRESSGTQRAIAQAPPPPSVRAPGVARSSDAAPSALPPLSRSVSAPATLVQRETAAATPVLAGDHELDELADRLYGRIRSRLRGELLIDRERAGVITDLR